MATFCLTKQQKEKFKNALKSGEADFNKLADFPSSQARRDYLARFVGKENAAQVNALYESKLLLPNQKAAAYRFVEKTLGLEKKANRDIFSKIEKMQEILNPADLKSFYGDLVDKKLGIEPTIEEARIVSDLSKKLTDLKESWNPKTEEWTSKADAKAYGSTQRALEIYIEELKSGKQSIVKALKDRGYEFGSDLQNNKTRAVGSLLTDTAKSIADVSVQAVATFDDSFFGRQGIFNLLSGHPIIWSRNFAKSFLDIAKTLGGKKTTDALLADLYSDPLYMNGEYQKAGILSTVEEQQPAKILESIPILGRPIEAFEAAFTNGSLRMRTDMYKLMRDAKVARGIEMTDKEIEGTASIANSLSARGHLDYRLKNPIVRLLMWAPSMLKADIDVLTAHSFADIPKADRVTARWNLIKIIAITTLINTIAQANGKDTELDPRSSDFLKFDKKYGYLRGIPQIITLFSRLLTGQYKNKDGEIIDYEPGIGKSSRLDAVYAFLRGKAPPSTGAAYDALAGEDYQGNEPTFTSMLMQRGVPISIQNLIKLASDPTVDNTFGVIADFFGLNSNISPEPNIKTGYIPTDKKIKESDLMDQVTLYAKAYGTDPETAWNKMFKGQKLERVADGYIVSARNDVETSQAEKKKAGKATKEYKLDHTIPLKLGGDESNDNRKIIDTALWKSYTSVETAMIRAVKNKKIKAKEAQELIVKFKGIKDKKERDAFGLELRSKYK